MSAPLTASGESEAQAALLTGYRPPPGHYDELLTPEGRIKPHWRHAIGLLTGLSETDRRQADETVQRTLLENGQSYVAPDGPSRPWDLDLLPVVIGAAEWRRLEAGLVQRARLLDAITADIYGPQRLLQDGHLPGALVYANAHFVRPACGVEVPGGTWLHLLAFDLLRGPDGRWRVTGDRTEAPAGSGYALENRIAVSRALPDLYRTGNVERLAGFFRAFSEHFLALSRHDPPLVVVLSAGQQRESYFDHAYLAQYLGYHVVEGADLTMRGERLFLKTVEGLRPVDLMVRHAPSDEMDPLELSGFGTGVPGLLRAVRSGRLAIANSVGSGLVQNEALMAYLPRLAPLLLDEDLALESVDTWWCGEEAGRRHVLEHLDSLAIRDVTRSRALLDGSSEEPLETKPDSRTRRRLEQAIRLRGYDFVGRSLPAPSTTPLWQADGSLRPAPMTLRVYLAATEKGYQVMPGGLTRVAADGAAGLPPLAWTGTSKDTWVVSEEPVEQVSLLPSVHQVVALRRKGRELPSRAADNLYWFGRYLERVESCARLLRSFVVRVGGAQRAGSDQVTPGRVVGLLDSLHHIAPETAERFAADGHTLFLFHPEAFFADGDAANSLTGLLESVRHLADNLRERLSRDTWEILQELLATPLAQPSIPGYGQARAARLLTEMVRSLTALNGLFMENMTRDFGWHFLDMGRRLERGWQTTRAINAIVGGDAGREGGLELMLELADSLMTYSWRYKAEPQLLPILDLLLLEDSNPRSVLFQVKLIQQHLDVLPDEPESWSRLPQAERLLVDLSSRLRLADIHALTAGDATPLERLLEAGVADFEGISDALTSRYFSHALETRLTAFAAPALPT